MKDYFYCAMHKTATGREYQHGTLTTDCPPTDPRFLGGLLTQVANKFDAPCSTGQVVILSLSLV
jgi:hypothetical protein